MKKIIIKGMCAVMIIAMIIIANIIIDPYNVFHADNVRINGVDPNKNYIKTKYIIDNPDSYDSFVIGASRCGYMNMDRLNDGTYYNLTYGGGNMYEFTLTLKTLLDNEVEINNILLGLDEGSYTERHMHDNAGGAMPYPLNNKLSFYSKYAFDTMTTLRSIPVMLKVPDEEAQAYTANLYTDGSWPAKNTVLDESTDVFDRMNYERAASKQDLEYIKDMFEDLDEFIDICEEKDINLKIYTHPLHMKNYGDVISAGYFDFLERLSDITEFYNFSGINDITSEYDNYYEWSHYTYDVTDKLIDVMYYDKSDAKLLKQGFGMYVDEDNKEEFLDILSSQLEEGVRK